MTADTPTPHRATPEEWQRAENVRNHPDYPWATLALELRDTLELTHSTLALMRASFADLAERVGALEGPPAAEPDVNGVIGLAAIIREADGNHSLGAGALAEAILRHPRIAEVLPGGAPAPAAAPDPGTRLHSFSVGEAKPIEDWGKGHTLVTAAPSPPAGSLVEVVAVRLAQVADPVQSVPAIGMHYWEREARAAIAAIARALSDDGWGNAAAWLEREAGR
jgi:hypothetical protein